MAAIIKGSPLARKSPRVQQCILPTVRVNTMISLRGLGLRSREFRPRAHLVRMAARRTVKTPTIDWKPLKSSVTNLTKAESQSRSSGFRKTLLGLMIAMPIISFGLGCWQVKRLRWKVGLIKNSEHMLAQEPLEGLPPNIDPSVIPQFEHRRFRIKGKFDYANEMFLGPRIRNGDQGYLIVTPFIRSDGGKPILIERGWIRKEMVIPSTRSSGYLSHLALPQGEITIEAMFRVMPKRSSLQFEHEEGSRVFYVPDVAAMAQQSGALPVYAQMMYSLKDQPWVGPDAPKNTKKGWLFFSRKPQHEYLPQSDTDETLQYQEFEFANQGVPIAAIPKVSFTNNHFQYLVTWFGVSLASSVLLVVCFLRRKGSSSADKVVQAKLKDMKKRF